MGTPGNTSAISAADDRPMTVSALAMMNTSPTRRVELHGQPDRLGAVTGIDIRPEVPPPEHRVRVEGTGTSLVIGAASITFENRKPIIFDPRVPTAEKARAISSSSALARAYRRLGADRVRLVQRPHTGAASSKGRPSKVSLDAPDQVADPGHGAPRRRRDGWTGCRRRRSAAFGAPAPGPRHEPPGGPRRRMGRPALVGGLRTPRRPVRSRSRSTRVEAGTVGTRRDRGRSSKTL